MIALFGAPGSGKTVQGQLLAKKYGWKWVSSRDLFLALKDDEIALALDHGMPIKNEKSIAVLKKALESIGTQNAVLDGFPSSVSQIYWMVENGYIEQLQCAITLRVPRGELWERMLKRGRVDDTRAAIERRQDIYDRSSTGIIHVLRENGVETTEVDGCNAPKDVLARIEEKLGDFRILDRALLQKIDR